jgi:hypothetical protein
MSILGEVNVVMGRLTEHGECPPDGVKNVTLRGLCVVFEDGVGEVDVPLRQQSGQHFE